MQFPDDIDTLWEMWERNVLNRGLNDTVVEQLGHHIEKIEGQCDAPVRHHHDEPEADCLAKAHRIFDQLCKKGRSGERLNHSQPGHRVIKTRYGAIYESTVAVRGIERLLERSNHHHAVQLKDGIYHVNHMPGVQPNASALVNARNKNVEKVEIEVIDRFVELCKQSGMDKRGWKKSVNDEFDISRQEFSKWLTRYLPLYNIEMSKTNKV